MFARRLLILLSLALFPAPLLAQEMVKLADGSLAIAVPEPVFLPAATTAVVKLAGMNTLTPKIMRFSEGLWPKRDVIAVLGRFESVLLSRRGLPGVHPNRPFYVGVYDPSRLEKPIDPPARWDSVFSIGSFSVIAVPVLNHVLFRGTLGEKLKFAARRDDGIFRFTRETTTFDYEAWAAANRDPESDPQRGDLSRFNRIERVDLFYVAADGYALLTTNADIAADCLAAARNPTVWRVVGRPPKDAVAPANLSTVVAVANGRLARPEDDIAVSIDVALVRAAHGDAVEGLLDRMRVELAAESADGMRATSRPDADPSTDRRTLKPGMAAALLDLWVGSFRSSLASLDRIEVSFTEEKGGLITSLSLVPSGERRVDRRRPPARPAESDVLDAVADQGMISAAADLSFDAESLAHYRQLAGEAARLAGLRVDDLAIGAWTKAAAERLAGKTGRFAVAVDVDPVHGPSLIDIVTIDETPPTAFFGADGPEGLWRAFSDGAAGSIRALGTRSIGGKDTAFFAIGERDGKTHFEVAIGTSGNRVVTVAGKNAESRYQALVSAWERDTAGASRPVRENALSPLGGVATMRGFVNPVTALAGMLPPAVFSSADEGGTFAHRSAFVEALRRAAEFAPIGFTTHDAAEHFTLRMHAAKTAILAMRDVMGHLSELQRVHATRERMLRLAAMIERYQKKHGRPPTSDAGLTALLESDDAIGAGGSFLLLDGWDQPISYRIGADGKATLVSYGKDGVAGGEGAAADIVMKF